MLDEFKDQIEFEIAGYALDHEVMSRKELKEKVRDIDILICEYDTIDEEIFDCAEQLKLIICCRGGVKLVVDIEKAMERGIIVCNNSGRNAGAVSDMVIGYLLDITRNITLTNQLIHDRVITTDVKSKPDEYKDVVWGLDKNSPFIRYRGKSLCYMTLGLVGCGAAGRLVAKKAQAFGMKVLAYDPYLDPMYLPDGVELVKFDRLLEKSDVISLHCVATPQTKGMISKQVFDKMKDGAIFINTARGELVDETALIEALKSGKLSGAAIDVTLEEPIASDCPLLDAPNLIITPHIGGSAVDVQITGTKQIAEVMRAWLKDEKPKHCVVYK